MINFASIKQKLGNAIGKVGGFVEDVRDKVTSVEKKIGSLPISIGPPTIKPAFKTTLGSVVGKAFQAPANEEEALKGGLVKLGNQYVDITGFTGVGSMREGVKNVAKRVGSEVVESTGKLLRRQKNLTKLAVPKEAKTLISETVEQIRPELQELRGRTLTNAEVVEAAKSSDVLMRNATRDATLKSEAALLRTRQHLAELAKGKTVTPEFVDTLKVISSEATQRGRELQALGIEADPELGSVRTKIIKELLKIGKSTDEIVAAAQGVDFTNMEQVTKFYRQFVKAKLPEIIDEYRYINLLSSPRTHIVNAFSNILQTSALRPATRLASGIADAIGSRITGKQREYYVSQVPAYYRGAFNSLGDATSRFLQAMRGESVIARPDITQIPSGSRFLRPFQSIPRLLEASDVFFRTLATGGELNALMSKGMPEAQAIQKATDTAMESVFRKALDPSNKTGQGTLLSSIDKLTNAVYGLRKVPLVKWFIPFVQTPMNILKQGIEYSPIGAATLPGNANKIEQIGKTMIGSTVFAGAGWLALNDRTTWAVPTGQKEKDLFYAAGKQPYALKVGDKWVSYSRLGPVAYPIAMAAAIRFYTEQNPSSVTDTDVEKTSKILLGIAKFFSDQSYMQGIGDIVNIAEGDASAAVKAITNIPGQLIPLSSLQRWVANIIDPVYRKAGSGISADTIIKNMERGLPFLSRNLQPYLTPFGLPSTRQLPLGNAFSPVSVTEERPVESGLLDLVQDKKKLDNIKKNLKEKLKEQIAPGLP